MMHLICNVTKNIDLSVDVRQTKPYESRAGGRSVWFGSPDSSSLGQFFRLVSAARSYDRQTNRTPVLLSACLHRHRLAPPEQINCLYSRIKKSCKS